MIENTLRLFHDTYMDSKSVGGLWVTYEWVLYHLFEAIRQDISHRVEARCDFHDQLPRGRRSWNSRLHSLQLRRNQETRADFLWVWAKTSDELLGLEGVAFQLVAWSTSDLFIGVRLLYNISTTGLFIKQWINLLLMEEILHHLTCMKPYKYTRV